jgi:transposase
MSYAIEVYQGQLEPTSDWIEYLLFVSFFPHLVAGPIMRATALLPQVQRRRVVTEAHLFEGATLFLIGFVRKIAIADPAGVLADQYFNNPSEFTTVPLVCGLVLYGLQTSAAFVAFLGDIVATQRKRREIHVIADNLSTHKTQAVRTFLLDHPNVHLHFTPTYSSWLNQVELWFAKIERQLLARGIFTSVADLARKIRRCIRHYNKTAKPVRWSYRIRRIELVVLQ